MPARRGTGDEGVDTSAQQPPPPSGPSGASGHRPAAGVTFVSLERQPCYGSCPVYALRLHGDGKVEFDGQRFTGQCGLAEGHVGADAWQRLLERFDAVDFWHLRDAYDEHTMTGCATDSSGAVIIVRAGEREKRVSIDHGCPAPKELVELESAIDEAASAKRWVDGCGERPPDLAPLDFDDGSSTLRPEHRALIDAAVRALRAAPVARGLRIEAAAFRDEAKASVLAQARASAVKAALVERGVEPTKLETGSGVGSDEARRAELHRVTLSVAKNACDCPGGSFAH